MSTITAIGGEFPPEIQELGDRIVNLSIFGAMQLGRYIREVHGIEPMSYGINLEVAPIVIQKEESSEVRVVEVVLAKVADQTKKISVIKVVREVTGLGLAESKAVVDKAPSVVKSGVLIDDAERMKAKLEEAGGTVELK